MITIQIDPHILTYADDTELPSVSARMTRDDFVKDGDAGTIWAYSGADHDRGGRDHFLKCLAQALDAQLDSYDRKQHP